MSKLVYTSNIPFKMDDWEEHDDIIYVSAGRNQAIAICKDGAILKKTCSDKPILTDGTPTFEHIYNTILAEPSSKHSSQFPVFCTNKENNFCQIAISHVVPCVVVGLRENGTCIVHIDREKNTDYGRAVRAKATVAKWSGIVEIVISDAIFALDETGNVHHFSFYTPDDYHLVDSWRNIAHIFTEAQNSIFEITTDGNVLCVGSNCGDKLQKALSKYKDVKDICTTGAECENVILLHKDGSVSILNGSNTTETKSSQRFVKLYGHFHHTVYGLTSNNRVVPLLLHNQAIDDQTIAEWDGILSFSMGQQGNKAPFAIAVIE